MIHSLESFRYKGTPIQVLGDYAHPLFVAKEVCEALNLADVYKATERLDEDEKLIRKVFVSGQHREMICINEPGLYSLVLRSTKPEAKAFKRWITHEVLPAIRKQGFYGIPEAVERKVKIELAKERLSIYITGSSIWDSTNVERFMELTQTLTNAELATLYTCSIYSITKLKKLLRNASGDFSDHRPASLKPEQPPQLDLLESLKREPLSEEMKASIWRMRAQGGLSFVQIAEKTGYSKERVRKIFHKHELYKEANHVD